MAFKLNIICKHFEIVNCKSGTAISFYHAQNQTLNDSSQMTRQDTRGNFKKTGHIGQDIVCKGLKSKTD